MPAALPAVDGNNLFWAMAALIAAEALAIAKLAGALYRSRHVPGAAQAGVPGGEPEWGPRHTGGRPQGDAPRRPGRRPSGRSRLVAAGLLGIGILLVADKAHLKFSGGAPGTAAPKPTVTVRAPAPHPHPAVSSPAPRVPPATAHAVAHSLLTGGDLTAVLIIAILGLTAYGINRAVRRNR